MRNLRNLRKIANIVNGAKKMTNSQLGSLAFQCSAIFAILTIFAKIANLNRCAREGTCPLTCKAYTSSVSRAQRLNQKDRFSIDVKITIYQDGN